MSIVNTMENTVLDAMLGASATLIGTPVEIALSTTAISDDGSGITEPSGGGYTRASVANDGTYWGAASGGIKTNSSDIVFPEAASSWGTITHWALYYSGTMKLYGIIDDGLGTAAPIDVNAGNRPRFVSGNLRVELD